MELIILGGIALVALLFNVAGMAFVFGRGGPVWDRRAQTEAKWLFGAILVAGVAIGAVWFGVAALLSIWPFWLALGVAKSAVVLKSGQASRRKVVEVVGGNANFLSFSPD
jgi:hypothetical protein